MKIKKLLKKVPFLRKLQTNYYHYKLKIIEKKEFVSKISTSLEKKNRIFILLEETHSNLGDVAIRYAQEVFLKENVPDYKLIIVYMDEFVYFFKLLKRSIKKRDIIVIPGGGNIGDEYIEYERNRRKVIKTFKKNVIISFPQTMYFSNTANGHKEFEITKKIYQDHKKLFLVAREEKTFKDMTNTFPNGHVLISPDIVFYLKPLFSYKRKGITLCLRNDNEKILEDSQRDFIYNSCLEKDPDVVVTDMHGSTIIPYDKREKEIFQKLEQFSKSKLVVTDRIHGMIFAAITATPCIALSNYNHKVKGTFRWIEKLSYVRFVEDLKQIPSLINELINLEEMNYNNNFALPYYQKIIDIIKGETVKKFNG